MRTIFPQALAASVGELPAFPAVVLELLDTMGRDDFSAEQFAEKLSHDQALTAKILRLANSSFYGVPRKVVSIREAISILGIRTVRSVVTAVSLVGSFKSEQCPGFDFVAFWRHSIGTGLCAKAIAEPLGLDGETAFIVGLMHDIGHLALAVFCSTSIAEVYAHQNLHDCSLSDAEQAVCGTDHTYIGRCVTERWRFAPQIVEAVATHHAPPEGSVPNLVSVLHVADCMAHALDLARLENSMVRPLNLMVWASLRLSDDQCMGIFGKVENQFNDLCRDLLIAPF